MPEGGEGGRFLRRLKTILRTDRFPFSLFLLGIGILLSVLATADFTPLGQVGPFPAIDSATDQSSTGGVNYNLLFAPVGPIVSIIGAYFVGAYVLARRKFEHLMVTKSKAEFLRNIPELEELLWDLTPRDEDRYADKRADLRIRR